jgi:hypothetical protein
LLESLGVRGVIDIEADGSVSQVVFNQSQFETGDRAAFEEHAAGMAFSPD